MPSHKARCKICNKLVSGVSCGPGCDYDIYCEICMDEVSCTLCGDTQNDLKQVDDRLLCEECYREEIRPEQSQYYEWSNKEWKWQQVYNFARCPICKEYVSQLGGEKVEEVIKHNDKYYHPQCRKTEIFIDEQGNRIKRDNVFGDKKLGKQVRCGHCLQSLVTIDINIDLQRYGYEQLPESCTHYFGNSAYQYTYENPKGEYLGELLPCAICNKICTDGECASDFKDMPNDFESIGFANNGKRDKIFCHGDLVKWLKSRKDVLFEVYSDLTDKTKGDDLKKKVGMLGLTKAGNKKKNRDQLETLYKYMQLV